MSAWGVAALAGIQVHQYAPDADALIVIVLIVTWNQCLRDADGYNPLQGGVWKGREEVASLRPKGKEFLREEGRGPIVEAQYKRYNHNLTMVTLI